MAIGELVAQQDSSVNLPPLVEEQLFALAQRKANVYAKSTLVPADYRNNIGNVLIAENMARRMGADTLMVMQNLYVVHGKPSWSAQFLIACFNSCGRFSAIKYRFSGTPGKDDWGCVAYTTEALTGELIEGVKVTIGMAVAEGWATKDKSKWKTIPELMLRYRAATFLIRCTAPEIGMGLMTTDEAEDVYGERKPVSLAQLADGMSGDTEQEPLALPQHETGFDFETDLTKALASCDDLAKVNALEKQWLSKASTDEQHSALAGRCDDHRELLRKKGAK